MLLLSATAIIPALCIGSFLAAVAYRLPLGIGIVTPRSSCPHCQSPLGVRELIPVFSWLLQKGRCRHCHAAIDGHYIVVETCAAVVAVWSIFVFESGAILLSCVFGWTLLTLAAIDARHHILPDIITLPLMIVGLAIAWSDSYAVGIHHTTGAAAGYIAFAMVTEIYRRTRNREGLGLGDAKLLAAAGAWLGWQVLPGIVFLAAVCGVIVTIAAQKIRGAKVDRFSVLAFGPYLALAIWLHWIIQPYDIFTLIFGLY